MKNKKKETIAGWVTICVFVLIIIIAFYLGVGIFFLNILEFSIKDIKVWHTLIYIAAWYLFFHRERE